MMRSTRYPKSQESPFIVETAPVDKQRFKVIAINQNKAAREAERLWRKQNRPRVVAVELGRAA